MDTKEFLRRNEFDANKKVAQAMMITFFIFTVIFILNILGIFIIPQGVMNVAYALSGILLIAPTFINKIVGGYNKTLKYVYVSFSALFILVSGILLSYHLPVVYAYPIVIAGIYFSKKVTNFSIIITIFVTILAQLFGFYEDFLHDANFNNLYELVMFSIIPKTFCLLAFSALLRFLTERTSYLLQVQRENDEEHISLSDDMISGFATLVENRDSNTGMHIKRTSLYVELLAKHLATKEKYKDIITEAFIDNLIKAAPMHDVGKISVPDSILQKPGPLTPDEFDVMKTHAAKGGRIILQTFGHVGNESYRKMAYEVVRYHHEKWNGRGYPEGRRGEDIPLSARIMAVCDVFDAISQNRCYRSAMSMDECFKIIADGSNVDFEPEIAAAFTELRPKIEKICNEFKD